MCIRWFACVLSLACGIPETQAADELLWLPDTINGLAIVRVAEIYASPIAKSENWAKTAAQKFVNQQAIVPPGTELLVLGSEFGISPELPAMKEYAVVSFGRSSSLEGFSELGIGDFETIEDKPTLTLRRGGFVVAEDDKLWRFTAPGGRQAGLRWLRQQPAQESSLSPFLQSAIKESKNAGQVLVALDLTDSLTPGMVAPAVSQLESLEKFKETARERIIKTLSGVRGLSLQVNVYEDLQAELRITFSNPPAPLAHIAGPLLSDILNLLGASLESSDHWKSSVLENALIFRGPISPAEVRRILALFRGHDLAMAGIAEGTSTSSTADEPTSEQLATASQRYYREVSQILDDLRDTLKNKRDNQALWFERSARSIDGLKLLNVDPDLLVFGQRVSSSLRYQGQALRNSNIRRGVRVASSGANNLYQSTSTYVGPYGGTYWSSTNLPGADAGAIGAQERGSAREVQFSEWKQIEDGLVAIRRTLTERYRTEF